MSCLFQTLKGSLQTSPSSFEECERQEFQTLKGSLQTLHEICEKINESGFQTLKGSLQTGFLEESLVNCMNVSNPQRIATNSVEKLNVPICDVGFKPSKDRYKLLHSLYLSLYIRGFKPSKDRYKPYELEDPITALKGFKPSKDRYKLRHIRPIRYHN